MLSSGTMMTTVEDLVGCTPARLQGSLFWSDLILVVSLVNLEAPTKVQDPVASIFEANASLVGSQYSK